jgi:pimeloyl-ACP methyl ester carboxylesterase
MRARFVDVDGVRVRVLYAGEGPALLLVHGVGLCSDTFIRNIDELAKRYAVIAPDLPGHGFTDAVDFKGEAPQRVTARLLCRLMEILGVDRYDVVGSSYGALVAALMWFEQPARVGKLTLIGSGAVFHSAEDQEKTLRHAAANASKALTNPTLETCRQRLAAICYDSVSVPEEILPVQLTSYALPDRFSAYMATIEGVIASGSVPEDRVLSRLEQLSARTLILTGREDIRAKWQSHVEGRKRMPNARISIMEKTGHLPYMEHPSVFNAALLSFLEGGQVGD